MDTVLLSKIQFFMTVGFHFIFPPITIGLAWIIVWFMIKYMRTKDQKYKVLSRFWLKIFVVTFGIGVPTGFILGFQFGTNWSFFSRFAGEVFGSMLAIEILFAFFFESVFLAVLIQGWNHPKVSERMLLFSAIIVALGTTLSAFFILAAISWMQTPGGYTITAGAVEIYDFSEALFTSSMLIRFFHTLVACFISAAFVMVGISAGYLLKNKNNEIFTESIRIGLIVGIIATLIQGIFGHASSISVAATQPVKYAAQEGIFVTQKGVGLVLFGLVNENGFLFKIEIPYLLSFLTHLDFDAYITGLDAYPVRDRPPIELTYYSFHFMVYLGVLLALFMLVGGYFYRKKTLHQQKRYLKFAQYAIPLPIIAIELGWITTEVGRQPWVIYGVLRTVDAVSPTTTTGDLLFSIGLFALIYIGLFIIWIVALRKVIDKGPEDIELGYNKEGEL